MLVLVNVGKCCVYLEMENISVHTPISHSCYVVRRIEANLEKKKSMLILKISITLDTHL